MKNLKPMPVCGLSIPVKEGTEEENRNLEKAYGCLDMDTLTVWIEERTPKHTKAFWKTHEALHAILNLSGAIYATAAALGLPREDPKIAAWEETFIRVVCPHILETFGPPRECPK